ncbi:MAG: Type 1 glutamine amidotransferase-like domain-containing protein [Clostridia bacterium]|nr:Type 1 glutamine amidotransferase-like domain-containing protein [Clostridia bacterium]
MNILLTSNGFHNKSKRSKEIDEVFEKVAKDKRVVIILNATKEGSNIQNIEDVRQNFEKIGAQKVDLLMLDRENAEDIFKYDVIYAMGGDPRLLLDDFWNYNFKQYLIKFLEKGIYIGESAGSMVLCDNLKWVWDIKKGTKPKYDILPKTFEGLNLVKQRIYPHYNRVSEEQKRKTDDYEKEHHIEITRLNDGEFIWV